MPIFSLTMSSLFHNHQNLECLIHISYVFLLISIIFCRLLKLACGENHTHCSPSHLIRLAVRAVPLVADTWQTQRSPHLTPSVCGLKSSPFLQYPQLCSSISPKSDREDKASSNPTTNDCVSNVESRYSQKLSPKKHTVRNDKRSNKNIRKQDTCIKEESTPDSAERSDHQMRKECPVSEEMTKPATAPHLLLDILSTQLLITRAKVRTLLEQSYTNLSQ